MLNTQNLNNNTNDNFVLGEHCRQGVLLVVPEGLNTKIDTHMANLTFNIR